jgi:hypothetical protein
MSYGVGGYSCLIVFFFMVFQTMPAPVVRKIIQAMEAGPPADVFGARSL